MTILRILLLPGWQNSGTGHWQTQWEKLPGFERVQQDDWWWPRRGDWMIRLEETLLADARPAVLVAHSLGCHLVAAWAAHSQHRARVAAALLVAPPDLARANLPPQIQAWAPGRPGALQGVLQGVLPGALPFSSTVVLSDDDPFCTRARGQQMAAAWGSEAVSLGAAGNINAASGLGDWPGGLALLDGLMQRAGLPAGQRVGQRGAPALPAAAAPSLPRA